MIYNPKHGAIVYKKGYSSTVRAIESCSDTDLAWLAGIIDGEGCLTVTKSGDYLSVLVKITMTHLPTMEEISKMVGNDVQLEPTGGNRKTAYRVCVGARRAAVIIRAVRPYLRTKAEHADILLEFASTLGGRVSNEDKAKRRLLADKIKKLNVRGFVPLDLSQGVTSYANDATHVH